jgi:hypothetical protein
VACLTWPPGPAPDAYLCSLTNQGDARSCRWRRVQGCTRGRWCRLGEARPSVDTAASAARVASIVEHR